MDKDIERNRKHGRSTILGLKNKTKKQQKNNNLHSNESREEGEGQITDVDGSKTEKVS